VDKETTNWMAMAKYDLESADWMLKGKRFVYAVFMCHMAVEKALKAAVRKQTGKTPPKTHDLIYLAGKSGMDFDEATVKFLEKINEYHLTTRYPEDFGRMSQEFTEKKSQETLRKATEILTWIEKHLK